MPTVVAHHKITKGAEHWLNSPRREQFFGPLGVTNIRTFVDPQDSTRVALVMDIADMDAVMQAMKGEAAAEAMANDGVVPESLVILVEILNSDIPEGTGLDRAIVNGPARECCIPEQRISTSRKVAHATILPL